VLLVRYLDVALVAITVPVLLLAGLPALGVLVGGGAWIFSRVTAAYFEGQARLRGDVRQAVGINIAAMLGRAWIVALAIVAAGLAGSREDGATAAALVLAAFTVYFVMTAFGRSLERKPTTT
jgi:hypothetical protein